MLESYKLSISDVPASYQGRLYFILGPGLGDTVNDFRILHEVLAVYPHASPIVYADPRWKDLYPLIPEAERCSWRFHAAAPSGELVGKIHQQSYSETLRRMREEIQSEIEKCGGYIALGGFTCLDQLAKKELGLATKARVIGLSLSKDRCRPFLPLEALPLNEVDEFLDNEHVRPGEYLVMSPQTWPDKAWPSSCWRHVAREVYTTTHCPIVVLGLKEYDVWEGPGLHPALGLPLPQVAGIIAKAKCFVGLDSGLTHVASIFDVPIVAMQAQGKFPPFLVEPHSPLRRVHVTPFLYGHAPIPPASIEVLVRQAMQHPCIPFCPLCEDVPYVLEANEKQSAYLCRCGLIYRLRKGQDERRDEPWLSKGELTLPHTLEGLREIKQYFQRLALSSHPHEEKDNLLTLTFEHWNARELSPSTIQADPTNRELWWSWDAMYHFLTALGWDIIESRGQYRAEGSPASYMFHVKARQASVAKRDVLLQVPWDKDLVWLKRSLYKRWLRWETFERPNELEDLGWRLVKAGFERDGRDILRLAAKHQWRGRTLSRLIRSEWKVLSAGMKNSQDLPAYV